MPFRRLSVLAVLLALPAFAGVLFGDDYDRGSEQIAGMLAGVIDSPTSNAQEVYYACDELRNLGPSAAIAAPALARALRFDEPIRTHAANALIEIGPSAIPALRTAMETGDKAVVATAAVIWATVESYQGVPIEVLLHRLVKEDPVERCEAAVALLRRALGPLSRPDKDSVVPSKYFLTWGDLDKLLQQAETGGHKERLAALAELRQYELAISDVACRIRDLLDDPAAEIARAAADALATMRDPAIPQFLDAVQSRDGFTRRLAVAALADPHLSTYRNRPALVKAVAHVLDDPDPLLRRTAAATLVAMWPQSEPVLTRAMKGGNDLVRDAVVDQLMIKFASRYLPSAVIIQPAPTPSIDETFADYEAQIAGELLRRMKSSDPVESERAFEVMRGLRSSKARNQLVAAVIHDLQAERMKTFQDENVRRLALLQTDFVPAWIDGARSKDDYTRQWCLKFLADRTRSTTDANIMAAMTAALGDADVAIRRVALGWAVSQADAPPGAVEKVAASLMRGNDLFDFDAENRTRAAVMLGQWAAEPKTSVPALVGALDEVRTAPLQMAAIVALRSFGTDARDAVPRLAPFLIDDHVEFRGAAAQTLVALGPEGRSAAVGYLIDVLRANRDFPLFWAVHNLAAAGPQAAAAAPDLTAMLANSPRELRIEVARALGEIGPPASGAFAALTRMVDNTNPDVRQAASEALLKIAPTGKGLGPALMAAVLNRDRVCAESLAAALQHSGETRTCLVRLTDLAANDPDPLVRATAHRAVEVLSRW